MAIQIYSRENCKACVETKKFLAEQDVPYMEILIDKDITRDEVLEKAPEAKMLPVVFVDDSYLGSKSELERYVTKMKELDLPFRD